MSNDHIGEKLKFGKHHWLYAINTYIHTLDDSEIYLVPVVTVVHDDIDPPIEEKKYSDLTFIVISITLRITMVNNWCSSEIQTSQNYHQVTTRTWNCFHLRVHFSCVDLIRKLLWCALLFWLADTRVLVI